MICRNVRAMIAVRLMRRWAWTVLRSSVLVAVVLAASLPARVSPQPAGARYIVLASTTSTENSGLFAHILPRFTAKTGIAVRVVAKGTGQALRIARNGDADVVLVHHRSAEERFVAEGHGVERRDVMYNDFMLIGPAADPAAIHGLRDAADAFAQIAAARAPFVSRGDDSGTHRAELRLWQLAGIDVREASGTWYRETGAGMGTTLNIGVAMGAYTLVDRGTWLSFKNRGDLRILVQGDRRLFNPYGVILVNPDKHPHVKAEEGRAFIDWLTGEEGQLAIASFRVGGQQAFFPNAR